MVEKKKILKMILIVIVVAGILLLIISFFIDASPTSGWFIAGVEYLEKLHIILASILLIIFYAAALLLILPGTPFNLAAGFLFGVWIGSLVTVIGCFLGALVGFVLGRYIIRSWAERMMEKNPSFKAIDQAIYTKGFLIVFLTRLSPIMPFGLCNYLFGVTSVGFFSYNLATFVGLLPGTIAYTYLGTLMKNLTDIYSEGQQGDNRNVIFVVGGVLLTILIIIVVTVVSKREIDKALKEQEALLEKKNSLENPNNNKETLINIDLHENIIPPSPSSHSPHQRLNHHSSPETSLLLN